MNEREDDKKAVRAELSNFMEEIRRDGKAGLAAFYERYKNMILRTALSVCRSLAVAEDVLDDVLIKVWKTAENSKTKRPTEGWLYVITVNFAKRRIKRYDKAVSLSEMIPDEDDSIEKMIARDAFLSMLEGLSDNEKRIVIGKFSLGQTFKELSEEMNRPTSTVSTMYYRALEKIEKNFLKKF